MSAEDRIQQLEGYIDEPWHCRQRVNIETLIIMYRTGELKSFRGPPNPTSLYVCDGQVFDDDPSDEVRKGRAVWFEVSSSREIFLRLDLFLSSSGNTTTDGTSEPTGDRD